MRRHTGYLWQNRDFMRCWVGDTVSLPGMQVTLLALSAWASEAACSISSSG